MPSHAKARRGSRRVTRGRRTSGQERRLTVCLCGVRPGLGSELWGTPQTSSSSCPHSASRLSPALLLEWENSAKVRQNQPDGACSLELRELKRIRRSCLGQQALTGHHKEPCPTPKGAFVVSTIAHTPLPTATQTLLGCSDIRQPKDHWNNFSTDGTRSPKFSGVPVLYDTHIHLCSG